MELNEYQDKAMGTCMNTCDNFAYMFLNLVGEVGEFASKVAKHLRRGEAAMDSNHLFLFGLDGDSDQLKAEAGDILWQLAGLCKVMGWSLDDVAQGNLDKLASRKCRGVIDGNGDNR